MRMAVLIAASALVAGCSQAHNGTAVTAPAPLTATPPSAVSAPTTTRTAQPAAGVPAVGAPIADVISWVKAGRLVSPGDFGSLTRDGAVTTLHGGIGFTTDTVNCISSPRYYDGALACLVKLTNPPPRPPDVYTVWKGNWVDFDGSRIDIGSQHGDPGPFGDGAGRGLAEGQTLAFGDFACRADSAAVFCVNTARQSGARFSASGVDGFGCLKPTTPPPDIGVRFAC